MISIFVTFTLNFEFISNLIIGDECKYSVNSLETNKLFDLFYTISSDTGYHPEPSYFNFAFTLCIGLLLGIFVSMAIGQCTIGQKMKNKK